VNTGYGGDCGDVGSEGENLSTNDTNKKELTSLAIQCIVYDIQSIEEFFMAQVNIRIDDDLKTRADNIFEELGLNMSTAFTMFLRQTIRQGGIPFEITTRTDPFYNAENLKVLRQSIKEANEGKLKAHDLIEE